MSEFEVQYAAVLDFPKLIDDAHELNKKHGANIKGKKYSTVAMRVELLRRHCGHAASVETEVLQFGAVSGEPVMVKAVVSINGNIVSTGHAFEIVGDGYINKTAALENAETSAVGRALAFLGLHGGEIASLNEIEGANRKSDATPTAEALADAWEDSIFDNLPEDPSPETVAEAYADAILAEVGGYKSERGLRNYWSKRGKQLEFVKSTLPVSFANIKTAFQRKSEELKK